MAEELNKPAGTPEAASQKQETPPASGQKKVGDVPFLFENIGVLVESTLGSVSGMLASATTVTRQVVENIDVTMNSDTVQGLVKNIGTVSENVIGSVNSTLGSEQLKNTIEGLGNLASGLVKTAESVVTSDQAKDLFQIVSDGLNQLASAIVTPVQALGHKEHQKKPVEIPFCHKTPCEPEPASEPEKKTPEPKETFEAKGAETPAPAKKEAVAGGQKVIESSVPADKKKEPSNTNVNPQGKNEASQREEKKNDPSRKGTFPRKNTDRL